MLARISCIISDQDSFQSEFRTIQITSGNRQAEDFQHRPAAGIRQYFLSATSVFDAHMRALRLLLVRLIPCAA